jgi:acyl-CoA hydrolase
LKQIECYRDIDADVALDVLLHVDQEPGVHVQLGCDALEAFHEFVCKTIIEKNTNLNINFEAFQNCIIGNSRFSDYRLQTQRNGTFNQQNILFCINRKIFTVCLAAKKLFLD